jgi:cytochrome oxidase Cu insertion factor (SCO1/SenC/PrrC family)
VYWELPAFSLVDQHGRTLGSAELAGSPWIADFIFTRCAGTCPGMTARMARLQSKVPAGTRLVSITVDPAHDTTEVLGRYAATFEAGAAWHFLTGPRESLYALAVDGFKLQAMEVPAEQQKAGVGDGPFLHSSKFALVDGIGRVRGYYDSTDPDALDRLVDDTSRLAAESR